MDKANWIGIPVYNCKELTLQVIRDVLSQDIPVKVLIVNNGSTDGTLEAILAEFGQDLRIYILDNGNNLGVGPAWNQICDYVFTVESAEHVWIINNDIRVRPDTYRNLLIPRGGFVTGVNVSTMDRMNKDVELNIDPEPIMRGGPDFSCFLVKRDFYWTIGGFPTCYWPGWFEDNEAHWVAKCKGLDKEIFSVAIPYVHIGSQTLKQNPEIQKINSTQFEKNRSLYIERWGGAPGREVFKTPYGT